MNKSNIFFGIAGILSAIVFIAAAVVSILGAAGAYTPLNGFTGELGVYSGSYFSSGTAQLFNIGLIAAGILIVLFMIGYGIRKNNTLFAFAAFFGIVSGILLAAQGVFSLNHASVHYIVVTAFSVSVFITCVLLIVATVITDKKRSSSLAGIILAFLTGVLSAAFAGYMFTGGMSGVFIEDLSGAGRVSLIPFAIVQWAAFVMLFALIVVFAVKMILESRSATVSASSKGNGKVDAGEVQSAEL